MAAAPRPCRLLGWPTSHAADGEPARWPGGHPRHLPDLPLPLAPHRARVHRHQQKLCCGFPVSSHVVDGARPCPSLAWMGRGTVTHSSMKTPEEAPVQGTSSSPRRSSWRPSRATALETELLVTLALSLPFLLAYLFFSYGYLFVLDFFFNICASSINFTACKSDGLASFPRAKVSCRHRLCRLTPKLLLLGCIGPGVLPLPSAWLSPSPRAVPEFMRGLHCPKTCGLTSSLVSIHGSLGAA